MYWVMSVNRNIASSVCSAYTFSVSFLWIFFGDFLTRFFDSKCVSSAYGKFGGCSFISFSLPVFTSRYLELLFVEISNHGFELDSSFVKHCECLDYCLWVHVFGLETSTKRIKCFFFFFFFCLLFNNTKWSWFLTKNLTNIGNTLFIVLSSQYTKFDLLKLISLNIS